MRSSVVCIIVLIASLLCCSPSCGMDKQRIDKMFEDMEKGNIQVGDIYEPDKDVSPTQIKEPAPTVEKQYQQSVQPRSWRIGAMWTRASNSDANSILDDGWGLEIEYALTPPSNTLTCLSLGASYRNFDNSASNYIDDYYVSANIKNNIAALGLKVRFGAGAHPENDGMYGGIGLGVAHNWAKLTVEDDEYIFKVSDDTTKLAWTLLMGGNFASAAYIEASYSGIGDSFDEGFYGVLLGVRF